MKILHRAKEKTTNNWVHGFYTGCQDFLAIEEGEPRIANIFDGTVGIFIGKNCSKTNVPIFTGDIVKDYQSNTYVVVFDEYTCSYRLRSSLIYSGSRPIDGTLTIIGNTLDNDFIEPEDREKDKPSITPTSQSSQSRSHKNALRGMGL